MPSEKNLASKQQIVADIRERLNKSVAGVVIDYKGINVAADTKLRKTLREAGVEYSVIKNTMLRHALAGTGLEELSTHLDGTTALATSETDIVTAAKLINKQVKATVNGSFTIKAGFVEGKYLDANGVVALAKLPAKNVLIATVLGTLNGPISALARCIQQIADAKSAPAEAPVEA